MAGGPTLELARLHELARSREPRHRRYLAASLGGLYLSGSGLSPRERALALEILGQVLHEAEMQLRRELAERLALESDVPQCLLMALANDEIEIARPVLLHSTLLTDEDLIGIVHRQAAAHRLAIAARRCVNAPVAEALVAAGDPDVAVTLVRNSGARLSHRALARLAERAHLSDALAEPLLSRPELTADLACRLYWAIGVGLRQEVIRRFKPPQEQLDRALQGTLERLAEQVRYRTALTAEHFALIDRLAANGAITPALLIQSLRTGQFTLFAELFARFSGLPSDMVLRIITQSAGDALAVACRAKGIDKGSFASIFLLSRGARPGDHRVDPRELTRVLSVFDTLTRDTALLMIKGWMAAPEATPFPLARQGGASSGRVLS